MPPISHFMHQFPRVQYVTENWRGSTRAFDTQKEAIAYAKASPNFVLVRRCEIIASFTAGKEDTNERIQEESNVNQ
jgi:hypothetical protein